MTPENQKRYDEKLRRLTDALELREPDRVPIDADGGKFMINYAGYQMKDAIYDTSMEIYREASIKFLKDFDPDMVSKSGANFYGEGPGHALSQSKNMIIAGMPGAKIDDDSLHQHVEFPTLLDDEFDEFFSDRTGWRIHKFLPRVYGALESFQNLNLGFDFGAGVGLAMEFTKPEVRKSIETLMEMGDFYRKQRARFGEIVQELIDMGYPDLAGGGAAEVPFDNYSDNYRGTLKSLSDLYIYEEEVERYTEEFHARQLERIRNMNKDGSKTGQYISHMLHKGLDGFMSDEHYEKFYWRHMREMMQAEIDAGLIPMMFCEGKYNSRLKYLKDSPKGRILFRFETIDMPLAKQELKGVACLGGGFPSQLLQFGSKQEVIDTCKRFLDEAMPGGGYIFRPSAGLDGGKIDNVIAMFETVKEYGRYH